MIDQLLAQLRTLVTDSDSLPAETRADLLVHLDAMEAELKEHPESGEPEAGTGVKLHGLARLRASVEELEASHPDLTALVSRLATQLSNLGI